MSQADVLRVLSESGPQNAKVLHKKVNLTKKEVNRMLYSMEAEGKVHLADQ